MSRSVNRVMLMGRVGREPETRRTAEGVPVTSFSLATLRRWVTPDGERRERTDWFHVVAWRRLAELCEQHLRGGMRIYLEGRLQTRAWQEPDGQRQYHTEIVATDIILVDDAGHELDAPTLHYEDFSDDGS